MPLLVEIPLIAIVLPIYYIERSPDAADILGNDHSAVLGTGTISPALAGAPADPRWRLMQSTVLLGTGKYLARALVQVPRPTGMTLARPRSGHWGR